MRRTPLTDGRKYSSYPGSALPPDLVGSSSRQLRKAISVPLATAQAGESAKHRRDRERPGEQGVSVMISPYGRRREVNRATRDTRRDDLSRDSGSGQLFQVKETNIVLTHIGSADHRPSRSTSRPESRSSDHRGQASDQDMRSESDGTSPAPPTPRRSSRLKRHDPDEVTPKPKRSKGKGLASAKKAEAENTTQSDTLRRSKRTTADKVDPPHPPPPVPSVPTITETVPSPGQTSSRSSKYEPRAETDMPRGLSNLRARTEMTKRTHTGAASFSNSRAGSPSTTGRYSAREEDLPPMEELEQAKIPLPSFAGISFGSLNTAPTPPQDQQTAVISKGASLLDRVGIVPPQPSQPAQSLGVPSSSRLSGGPLTRRNGEVSTRPRASSPLAAGSIVAEPESPPNSSSLSQPVTHLNSQNALNGIFRLSPSSGVPTPAPQPITPLFAGLRDLSYQPTTSATEKETSSTSSGIPDFFGTTSKKLDVSTPAPPTAPFNFGLAPKSADSTPAFSFGAQPATHGSATNGTPGVSGESAVPVENSKSSIFSFSTPNAASTSSEPFSFATTKPAETSKPAFSFSTPSSLAHSIEKPAGSQPTFSFASTSSTPPVDQSVEPKNPPFSFGVPNSNPMNAETPKLSFGFGSSTPAAPMAAENESKPAGPISTASSTTMPSAAAPAPSFGGFKFIRPAEPVKVASTAIVGTTTNLSASQGHGALGSGVQLANGTADPAKLNPFTKDAAATPPVSTTNASTPAFTFGSSPLASRINGGSALTSGFGAPAGVTPSPNFDFGSPASAGSSNPFANSNIAQPSASASASPAPLFNFGMNHSSTPAAASNPFASTQQLPSAAAGGFGFNFNANPSPTPSGPSFGFGQSNPNQPTPSANPGFSFGTPNSSNSPASFTFGAQGSSATPQATPPSFGFGAPSSAPRFGSPVPGPPTDGGFSLGMGPDAQAPISPSGRKIKPLRRGAVKR